MKRTVRRRGSPEGGRMGDSWPNRPGKDALKGGEIFSDPYKGRGGTEGSLNLPVQGL